MSFGKITCLVGTKNRTRYQEEAVTLFVSLTKQLLSLLRVSKSRKQTLLITTLDFQVLPKFVFTCVIGVSWGIINISHRHSARNYWRQTLGNKANAVKIGYNRESVTV